MCECRLCQRNAEFDARLQRLPEDERAYWESIYEDLCGAEFDRDQLQAVVDGSWPDADDLIKQARDRIALTEAGKQALRESKLGGGVKAGEE